MCCHNFTFFTPDTLFEHGFEYFTTECEAERERKNCQRLSGLVHLLSGFNNAVTLNGWIRIKMVSIERKHIYGVLTNFPPLTSEWPCVKYEQTHDDQEKDVPPPSGMHDKFITNSYGNTHSSLLRV